MKKRFKKLAVLFVTTAMTAGSVVPMSAMAADTNHVPTAAKTVNTKVVTATAHRAAAPLPEMLGANTPAGFGMINGSAPTSANYAGNLALEVWGSNLNTNPDPYWWNYYYNFAADADHQSADALLNPAVSGSPIKADTTVSATYGGVSVSLYKRPDILIGVDTSNSYTGSTKGYDDQLATIAAKGETYNPAKVKYNPTTLDDMVSTVYDAAAAIDATKKATRYGEATAIADDYSDYVYGIRGYIKHNISSDKYKKIAIVTSVTDDNGTNKYNIVGQGAAASTSTNRYVEYTEGITKNLTSQANEEVTISTLNNADAIIVTNSAAATALKNDMASLTNGKEIISAYSMKTLYGISMNSVENALGMGYILARIYDNNLPDIDAQNVYKYFASKFYHIRSGELDTIFEKAVSDTANAAFGEADDLHPSGNAYNESDLETLFSANADYAE